MVRLDHTVQDVAQFIGATYVSAVYPSLVGHSTSALIPTWTGKGPVIGYLSMRLAIMASAFWYTPALFHSSMV